MLRNGLLPSQVSMSLGQSKVSPAPGAGPKGAGYESLGRLSPRGDLEDLSSSAGFSTALSLRGWLSRNSPPGPQALAQDFHCSA